MFDWLVLIVVIRWCIELWIDCLMFNDDVLIFICDKLIDAKCVS